jgi:hypothetical protein
VIFSNLRSPTVPQNQSDTLLYLAVALEVLERKRIIGEYVHKATQYLDEGSLDLESVDYQIQPYLAAYQQFINESGFRPRLIEHRLVESVNGMLCGGTVDREGTMAGKRWVIDLKCIERLYPSFALQTAGYELLLPKPNTPPFRYTRAVLQLRSNGSYKLTLRRSCRFRRVPRGVGPDGLENESRYGHRNWRLDRAR